VGIPVTFEAQISSCHNSNSGIVPAWHILYLGGGVSFLIKNSVAMPTLHDFSGGGETDGKLVVWGPVGWDSNRGPPK